MSPNLVIHPTVVATILMLAALSPLRAGAQPAAPPPVPLGGVPILVGTNAAGVDQIQIGDTAYPAPTPSQSNPGGYQVLVLDRTTLALVDEQTYAAGDVGTGCDDAIEMTVYLEELSPTAGLLVIINGYGEAAFPAECIDIEEGLSLIDTIAGLGSTPTGFTGTSYALVGAPGLGEGNGWERSSFNAPGNPDAGTLEALLVPSTNGPVTVADFRSALVVTNTTQDGMPGVLVGDTFYPAGPPGQDQIGGFQLVALNQATLEPLGNGLPTNKTYFTSGDNFEAQIEMAVDLATLVPATPGPTTEPVLIILSTVGTLSGDIVYEELLDYLLLLGVTQQALSGSAYSLVASTVQNFIPPEASPEIPTSGSNAQLTVVLRPNQQGLFVPAVWDSLGYQKLDYNLYEVLAPETAADWPVPVTDGQRYAFEFVSRWMSSCEGQGNTCQWNASSNCPLPDQPPSEPPVIGPACTGGMDYDCGNIRSRYCMIGSHASDLLATLQGTLLTELEQAARHSTWHRSFSICDLKHKNASCDLAVVVNQISSELEKIQLVNSNVVANINNLLQDMALLEGAALRSVVDTLISTVLKPSQSAPITYDLAGATQIITEIAGAVANVAGADITVGTGLVGAFSDFGVDFGNPDGNPAQVIESTIDQLSAELFTKMEGGFVNQLAGVGQAFNVILGNWGRLDKAWSYITGPTTAATWGLWDDDTNAAILDSFVPAYTVTLYQSMLPLVAKVTRIHGPIDSPNDFEYEDLPCGRDSCTCYHPFSGVPENGYLKVGTETFFVLSLHSSTVLDPLFATPPAYDDTTNTWNLAVYPPHLFQSRGGWSGLQLDVLSEDYGCSPGSDVDVIVLADTVDPFGETPVDVAVMGDDRFDASAVDLTTLRAGRTGQESAPLTTELRHVNGDPHLDLVARFDPYALGVSCGDTSLAVSGLLQNGKPFTGTADVTVACRSTGGGHDDDGCAVRGDAHGRAWIALLPVAALLAWRRRHRARRRVAPPPA